MTSQLPFDLLCEVASHLQGDNDTLFNCALVSRQWQCAFERILYQSIYIMTGHRPPRSGLSLRAFLSLASRPGGRVRKAITREVSLFAKCPELNDADDLDEPDDTTNEELESPWDMTSEIIKKLLKRLKSPADIRVGLAIMQCTPCVDPNTVIEAMSLRGKTTGDGAKLPNLASINSLLIVDQMPIEPRNLRVPEHIILRVIQACTALASLGHLAPEHMSKKVEWAYSAKA
jgi:hypothetical protein